jgi:hypothetical protein
MKQFLRLLDALKYRTHCPLCNNKLQVNGRDLVQDYDINNPQQKIAFELSGSADDILYVDPITEKIELVIGNKKPQLSWGNHPSAISGGTTKSAYYAYHGVFGHALTIECEKCSFYSYTLQFWADLERSRITGIFLNSETVSWEDEANILHEIVSSYATNKTRYSYFGPETSQDDGQIVLSFIPVDVNNPKEAVSRIRNLIIFS